MVGGGWVKSHLRTRIARLVPSMRRLTHLSLVSSSQFYKYLSLFSRLGSLAGRSQVARGCSLGGSPLFLWNNAHSEKVCSSPREKKESRPGGSPNSLGNKEHSAKALSFLSFFFHFFIFFHFLSFSFIFFHFHLLSFIFLDFLAFSFVFFHFPSFLSFSFILFFFYFLSFFATVAVSSLVFPDPFLHPCQS